jgi:hypothetical protein
MPRFLFGGGPEDVYLIQDTTTGFLKPGPGAQALFYSDQGMQNRYTDLQSISGQPVSAVTTETGTGVWSSGQIAPLYGPDNVTEMYVSVAGSPPYLMQASAFGSWALPLLIQLQQLVNQPAPSLANLTDTDSASIAAAAVGNAVVKLANGRWGAGTVASGGGSGGGDATLAGAQTFTGAKTFSALLTAAAGALLRPSAASGVAAIVQGLASQTGNLEEWRNSAGSALAWVDSAGNLYAPNVGRTLPLSRAGALTVGVGTLRVYNDSGTALKVKSVRASIGTAASSGTTTFDVKVNGATIYTTTANRPSIASGQSTSGKSTGFNAGAAIPDGGYVTADIVAVGTGAADGVVQIDCW